ncbi:MAG: alpha-glucosidase [Clostridiaceae bacterium]|jgi:oligo-1,6-glucosidase|nr:alpha-glucosidase [Clostridiaceae bacterium]
MKRNWWQDKIVYQIYPMSFSDSNGDGVGDILGIINRLDYLEQLGVDLLWISPLYPSPNRDNGYDISDYCAIHPNYGTMNDFDRLVKLAGERGIKILMDLVINHTSDQHVWFQKSRQRIDPYTDFYIWQPGQNDNNSTFPDNEGNELKKIEEQSKNSTLSVDSAKEAKDNTKIEKMSPGKVPNNWGNFFGEIPWTYDEMRGEYYLHLFAKEQPDLNYRNEKVIEAVEKVMEFWLDRGVVGFRCDVINILYKNTLKNGKPKPALTGIEHYLSTPGLHQLLRRFNQNVWSKYDAFTVGETVFITTKMADDLANPARQELSAVFSFEHMETDCFKIKWFLRPFSPNRFFKTLSRWQENLFWNTIYFENHDQPRSVSRFGDADLYHRESAKALALLLMGLKGTVFLYQGQEIGMTNFDFASMDELRDIESHNIWKIGKRLRFPKRLLWKMMTTKSRDNARTPMQWSDEPNAGFTTGKPWLGINRNYKQINVKSEKLDAESILQFYQRIIRFRKKSKAMRCGDFRELHRRGSVYAFERSYSQVDQKLTNVLESIKHVGTSLSGEHEQKEKLIIVVNLSGKRKKSPYQGPCLFSSYERDEIGSMLDPYEAAILKVL